METNRDNRRRNRKNKDKKLTYKMQANFLLAFGAVLAAMVLLVGVLIKINIKDGEKYAKRVLSQQSYTSSEIPFKRGDIVDRNNVVMATSIKKYDLAIDVSFALSQSEDEYLYRSDIKEVLIKYFKVSESDVEKAFKERAEAKYFLIKKEIPTKTVDGFEEYVEEKYKEPNPIKKALWFEERYERIYPLDTVASSIIGFTYDTNQGNWGIEERYNSQLNGSTGRIYGYFNSDLSLEETVKSAEDGNTIITTIDSNVQSIVEKYIKKFNEDVGSKNAAVVIGDPNTGNIVAMASSNGIYDLNNPRDLSLYYEEDEIEEMSSEEKLEALNNIWRNYCISDTYEPGSTFKPFVVAAALEEGIVTPSNSYYCDGREVVAAGTSAIRCAKREGHGTINLNQALAFSCNDAMMNIGKNLGRTIFASYQKHFNFSKKTGVDLNGEASGIVYNAEQLNPVELATSSFGQGLNVTMVQMFAGISSLVNGGNYYVPKVVDRIVNSSGATIERCEPILKNKVISKETSEFIKESMENAVKTGTAKYAHIDGYNIGGKTGTAQKLPRSEGNYLVSFIGCVPCDEPELIIYTIVDEPNVEDQAQSKFAQELSANILREVLPFMEIYSSSSNKQNNKKTSDTTSSTESNNGSNDTVEDNADNSNAEGNSNQ
ncbi:MAG: penicillin-binding protein 2 [Lachnospiraceae bacterium]|nr:penicillin-binding protein 2 [Lachnospiraceae bacterium]